MEQKSIEVSLDQRRSLESGSKEQGLTEGDVTVESKGSDIDQQLSNFKELQRMMWEVEKRTFMESPEEDVEVEAETGKETAFPNILPKGGHMDDDVAVSNV